jgi:4-aminobutyrate aminotransferase/(S)-3-amino-2-methylpropionate transaminase
MDAPDPGGLGGTYAASPPACAAALTVLDIIEDESLCDRANEVGARLKAGMKKISDQFPGHIGDIRGKGAMVAMELVKNGDVSSPDPELTGKLVSKASEAGLLIISCGSRGNVIRVLAPLTIHTDHLEEGLDILAAVFAECIQNQ